MALGATALNFVTIGPALLVGGLAVAGQGQRALTRAREKIIEVEVAMAQMDQVRATLEVIDKRISELRSVLDGLRDRGIAALDELVKSREVV